MKKKLLALLLLLTLIASLALTACSGGGSDEGDGGGEAALTDWEYIQDKGVLVVGLDDTFAPMGFRDENDEIVGLDIDLARAVGKQLGVEVEFKPIDWDAKEMELSSGNIDCIWNGMSATPERQESMSLSNKYMNNRIVLMSTEDIEVVDGTELADLKIGVQVDSAALEALEADPNYADFEANVTQYPTYDEAILDMKAGRINVIAIDEIYGNYKNETSGDTMFTMEYDLGDDFYSIGFRKEDVETTAKVNEALQAVIASGEAEEISNKWFGTMLIINEGY